MRDCGQGSTLPYSYGENNVNKGFPGGPVVKNLPAMQETWVESLGGEDPLGGRAWQPTLVLACLENPMDRGAWQATVHKVT